MNFKKLVLVTLALCFSLVSVFAVETEKQSKARTAEKTTDVGGEVDFYLEYPQDSYSKPHSQQKTPYQLPQSFQV